MFIYFSLYIQFTPSMYHTMPTYVMTILYIKITPTIETKLINIEIQKVLSEQTIFTVH